MAQTLREKLEEIAIYTNYGFKAAIAIGVTVIFSYLTFQAKFFPSGVAIGDSLLFLFASLAFGMQYLLWVGLGYVIVTGLFLPFSDKENQASDGISNSNEGEERRRFFKKKPNFTFDNILLFVASILFLLVFGFLGYARKDLTLTVAPLLGGLLLWMALNSWRDKPNIPDEEKIERNLVRLLIILMGLVLPVIISISTVAVFTTASLRYLGLYVDNASLELSEDNYRLVESVAKQTGAIVLACASPDGKNRVVHGYKVWWHGVGDRSLVEPLRHGSEKSSTARIELKREGVNVIRWDPPSTKFEACLTLPTDSVFNSNEDTLNTLGIKRVVEIEKKLDTIKADKLEIIKITVIGHSDRIPVLKNGDSNLALSTRRALAVEMRLKKYSNNIDSYGVGPTEPKVTCNDIGNKKILEECLMPNRRVEIRVEVSEPKH